MKEDLIDLDDFLASRSIDVYGKLQIYEAVLANILRKYIPSNKKIEINLFRAYTDTVLDITLNADGKAKISWGEDKHADI
jgi:hypothetical protein